MANFQIDFFKNTDNNYKIAIGNIEAEPIDKLDTTYTDNNKLVSIVDNLLMRITIQELYKVLDMTKIRIENKKNLTPYHFSFCPAKTQYFKIQRVSKVNDPLKNEIGEISSVCIQKLTKNLPFAEKLPDEFVLDEKPSYIWYLIRSANYLIPNTKYNLFVNETLPSKTLTIP